MKAAWTDRDDNLADKDGLQLRKVRLTAKQGSKYQNRLVDEFKLVHGQTPSWAKVEPESKKRKIIEGDEDPETKGKNLTRGQLRIRRVLDLNNESRESGPIIRSVRFHPTSQVGLVAGGHGVALYQVDGTTNTKIQSVEFENFPLRNACFSTGGEEILVSSGLMGHFYSYDMLSGEITKAKPNRLTEKETIRNLVPSPDKRFTVGMGHHGNMYLFSSGSKEVIDTLTMNGDVSSVTFNSDGSRMYSYGDLGEIYTWDMKNRCCVDKFTDHGTVSGTRISVSDEFLACGSNAGVVNIYSNRSKVPSGAGIRTPEKSLLNLVTPISSLEFNNPAGEILIMSSKDKPNALKMVHLPSLTVFNNFPFVNTDYGRPNSLAFSPSSGYLAMGNNRGTAMLFRLDHYENY